MKLMMSFVIMTCFWACAGKSGKNETTGTDTASQPITLVTQNDDTMVVDKNAAVYYRPDTVQLSRWKKEVGEKDFETVIDDWSHYMNSSGEFLKNTSLPVEDATGKKVLKFVKADKSMTIVRLDTLSNFWGLYLFSTTKEPQFTDIIMMEELYKSYYK